MTCPLTSTPAPRLMIKVHQGEAAPSQLHSFGWWMTARLLGRLSPPQVRTGNGCPFSQHQGGQALREALERELGMLTPQTALVPAAYSASQLGPPELVASWTGTRDQCARNRGSPGVVGARGAGELRGLPAAVRCVWGPQQGGCKSSWCPLRRGREIICQL